MSNSIALENDSKYYSSEAGTLSLMYHRFNENKYPSTNVRMEIFEKQIQIIKNKKYKFENPDDFQKNFEKPKDEKKILITIDDAFSSFYENAWPFLKRNEIPFTIDNEFLMPAKLPGPRFTYIWFISDNVVLYFFKKSLIKIVILSKLILLFS